MRDAANLPADLNDRIIAWGRELGFQQVGVSDIDLSRAERRIESWLAADHHGEMAYMSRHGTRRSRPAELIAGTRSVISTRMDYLPMNKAAACDVLHDDGLGYIARYALGRDYHKVLRRRLQKLADRMTQVIGPFGYRAFVDSAPVLEKPLAEKAGLGWIGKHTNILNKEAGSWFLLGELYTDLQLNPSVPARNHCGSCRTCLDVCPTRAIIAPYKLDARRCISYLTIELDGTIPVEFRTAIGNRIFGCDDCQLFCPWNKFAQLTAEPDFAPRHDLDATKLVTLFAWSYQEWKTKTAGSALRRTGYTGWLRNIAVALGNAATSPEIVAALNTRRNDPSEIVREHVEWGLQQHGA